MDINHLNELGEKWLKSKIQRMKNLLKIAEPDEALYREIMLSLGYPKNKVQFLELALILPYKEIKKIKERELIEKALLYRGGFIDDSKNLEHLQYDFDFSLRMDKSVWNFKGIRPANHPDKRITGISYLLSETTSSGLVHFFTKKIQNVGATLTIAQNNRTGINPAPTQVAKTCVNKIMDFKGLGIERKREMFFNIILPFYRALMDDQDPKIVEFLNTIFSYHPPLSENSITKKFKSLLGESRYYQLNISTKTYFGIHYYIKELQR